MNIRPFRDHIIVEKLPPETRTASGLIIPDTADKAQMRAKVLAIGDGKLLANGKIIPLSIKVGDIVMLGGFGTIEFKHEGREWSITNEDAVMVVLEEEDVIS